MKVHSTERVNKFTYMCQLLAGKFEVTLATLEQDIEDSVLNSKDLDLDAKARAVAEYRSELTLASRFHMY